MPPHPIGVVLGRSARILPGPATAPRPSESRRRRLESAMSGRDEPLVCHPARLASWVGGPPWLRPSAPC